MRKIYKVLKVAVAASLLSGLVVSAGCTREETLPAEAAPQAADPDYVSVESALAALARFEADDPATRAEDASAVAHVDVLMRSDVAPATRTAVAAADAPLCYIAQFEGGGYAILGADVKQGGVIAYVPKGTLTAADLAAAKAATDRGEDYETHTYIHACMVNYLEAASDGKIERETCNDIATRSDMIIFPMPTYDPRLLRTEWHQWYPYNELCPYVESQQAPVGCVALALGQILAYNKLVSNVGPEVIRPQGSYTYNPVYYPQWTIITQAIEKATPPASCWYELAQYLKKIGEAVCMQYGVENSTTGSTDVITFLKNQAGYKNVSLRTPKFVDIQKMIQSKNPVYARGLARINDDKYFIKKGGAHAWVIDGYDTKEEIFTTPDGYIKFDYNYVHCRYGYGGDYDGWYLLEPRSTVDSYNLEQIIYYTL